MLHEIDFSQKLEELSVQAI